MDHAPQPPRPSAGRGGRGRGLLAAGAVALGTGARAAWRELAAWAVAVESGRSLLLAHLGAGMASVLATLGVLAAGRRRVSR